MVKGFIEIREGGGGILYDVLYYVVEGSYGDLRGCCFLGIFVNGIVVFCFWLYWIYGWCYGEDEVYRDF